MFLTLLGFSAEREVGWKVMIGDGDRLLVVVAKIGDARELVRDRVREGERAPRRRRADESCEAVSSCIDVIAFDRVGDFFEGRSLL